MSFSLRRYTIDIQWEHVNALNILIIILIIIKYFVFEFSVVLFLVEWPLSRAREASQFNQSMEVEK